MPSYGPRFAFVFILRPNISIIWVRAREDMVVLSPKTGENYSSSNV